MLLCVTDSLLGLIPFFKLVVAEPFSNFYSFTGPTFLSPPAHNASSAQPTNPSPTHLPGSSASEPGQKRSIISEDNIEGLISLVKQTSHNFRKSLKEKMIYTLLLSVLEGVSVKSTARGTTQISSTIHFLQGVTSLFEELISLWLQAYNKESSVGGAQSEAYKGTVQIARITLRFWLVLSTQILHSSLSPQQTAEVKPLLSTPLASVSKACYNLQQSGLFKGNETLDQEFTLVILESVFSSLFAANICAVVLTCSVDDFYEVLRDTLSDGSHEWFTYLCSKLHGVTGSLSPSLEQQLREYPDQEDPLPDETNGHQPSNWAPVLNYSFQTLSHLLKELIAISSHIQSCQKASKLALTSTYEGANNRLVVPFLKPVVYSLEVATGFDKLTQRLSKVAQLLLDMFRSVPLLQLLSLQLLSETAKDTVGTISNFLSSISDLSVRSNAEVLDLYLELLENVWFRLPSDYQLPASSPWWNKLSNYSVLLQESNQEIVCQVIYHLQCLFGHESSVLKSRLTQFVIIPFHQHLTSLVKDKCYKKKSQEDGDSSPKSTVYPNAAALNDKENVVISLFMKLLAKVMSSAHSLGKFASDSSNLYSLFLYLPLTEFRAPALAVIEECLQTLKATSVEKNISSPNSTTRAATPETEETGIQKTIVQILLRIAFTIQLDRIPDMCLSIAEGRGSLTIFGLREIDQMEQLVRNTFVRKPLKELLIPSFVQHLGVVADIWSILNNLAVCDSRTVRILDQNNVWYAIESFLGSCLASLLSRLQQRLTRGEEGKKVDVGLVNSLRESAVTLLSHLLTLAHFLCWKKNDLKVRDVFSLT